jgi:hypothetical protein
MNLKRDNWTKSELAIILCGYTVSDKYSSLPPDLVKYNQDIQNIIDTINKDTREVWTNKDITDFFKNFEIGENIYAQFCNFLYDEDDCGALAFDTESGRTFCIGTPLPQ